jgi:hypothetical protein
MFTRFDVRYRPMTVPAHETGPRASTDGAEALTTEHLSVSPGVDPATPGIHRSRPNPGLDCPEQAPCWARAENIHDD